MELKHYKDLIVWRKAMDLVYHIYQITKLFPKEEIYGLTSQLRRAAVSVASNIAEGQARKSKLQFKYFLTIAKGSIAEIDTQLLIAIRLNYIQEIQIKDLITIREEVSKMLSSMITKFSPATEN